MGNLKFSFIRIIEELLIKLNFGEMEDWCTNSWFCDIFSDMGPNYKFDFTQLLDQPAPENKNVESTYKIACQPKTIAGLFIEDQVSCLHELSSKIESAKNKFMKNYTTINEEISKMAGKISELALNREKELKNQLVQIRREKMSAWNRQLAICENAVAWLENIDITSISLIGDDTFSKLCSDKFIKEINFVDSGEIRFETGDYDIVNMIGTLSCGTSSPSKESLVSVREIEPKFVIGSKGSGPGQFCRPWGVCTDVTGRILVADRSNNRIQIFNEFGKFMIEFGTEGSGPGEFQRPTGITVDKKCRIVVADKDNHRIQVFTYSGRFLLKFGKEGNKIGCFNYPWDVATNCYCDIAVSDSKNHRVQLFNEKGRFITKVDFNRNRVGLRTMDMPRGLVFCPNGKLLVTDFNNHKIIVINEEFKIVKTFGHEGGRPREFFRPQGIACDSKGRFVIADSKNYRIQFFDNNGFVCNVIGTEGNAPGQFDCPQGVAIHRNGSIIVADLNNNRIQIF